MNKELIMLLFKNSSNEEIKEYIKKIINNKKEESIVKEIVELLIDLKNMELINDFIYEYRYTGIINNEMKKKIINYVLNNIKSIKINDVIKFAKINDESYFYVTHYLIHNKEEESLFPLIKEFIAKIGYSNIELVEIIIDNKNIDDEYIFNLIKQDFRINEIIIDELIKRKSYVYLYKCLNNDKIKDNIKKRESINIILSSSNPYYIYLCAKNINVTKEEKNMLTKAIINTCSLTYMFKYLNNIIDIDEELFSELKEKYSYLDLLSKKENALNKIYNSKNIDLIISFIDQYKLVITKEDIDKLRLLILSTYNQEMIDLFDLKSKELLKKERKKELF